MNEREVLELLRALMMYAASRSTPSGVRTLACLTDAVDFKLFELTSKAHAQPANEPLPLGHYRCTHHGCTLIDTPTSGHSHGHEGGTLMYAASEAQGEPPTIEECDAEFRRATVEEATRRLPSIRTEDAVEIHLAGISAVRLAGIAAVRALCLSRTPSPSPALAAIVDFDDDSRSPAECGNTALDALLEAGDAVCLLFEFQSGTGALRIRGSPDEVASKLEAYDRARAALPKGGGA